MTAQRALVARTGRKQHWAVLYPGDAAWVPVCDVAPIPVFGATPTAIEDWAGWISAAQHDTTGAMCILCRRPLLAAARAIAETHSARIDALEQEGRRLRAELSRWTTAALAETKQHADFVREHVVFRRAER